jgi:hypothetical protein
MGNETEELKTCFVIAPIGVEGPLQCEGLPAASRGVGCTRRSPRPVIRRPG